MKQLLSIFSSILLTSTIVWADSSGMMARLVDDQGRPLLSPLNLTLVLRVDGVEKCRQQLLGVSPDDGHINIPMDFPNIDATYGCDSSALLTEVLREASAQGQVVSLQIEDNTNATTYNPQIVSQVPLTVFAHDLTGNGAEDQQYLRWDGGKWTPTIAINPTGCAADDKLKMVGNEFVCGPITSDNIAEGAVDENNIADGAITASKVADLTVVDDNILNANITADKIAPGIVLDPVKFGPNAFGNDEFADDSITTSKIANLTIRGGKIQAGALTTAKLTIVPAAKIALNTLEGSDFANDAITATKIVSDTIATVKIADNTISSDKVQDDAIDTIKIADGGIETANIANSTLTASHLQNEIIDDSKTQPNTLQTAKIIDNAITTVKFTDGTVATVDIQDQGVVHTKLSGISSNCGAGGYISTDGSGGFQCETLQDSIDIKSSMIMMWWRPQAQIPGGWQLCDGTNSTPDLRGRFIKATGTLTDTGMITGGSIEHNHHVSWSGSHTHEINATGTHTHIITRASDSHSHTASGNHGHGPLIGSATSNNPTMVDYAADHPQSLRRFGTEREHAHTIELSITVNDTANVGTNAGTVPIISGDTATATVIFSGTTGSHTLEIDQNTADSSILPPFMRLYYICKL